MIHTLPLFVDLKSVSVSRNHDKIPGIEEANETTRLNSDYEKSEFFCLANNALMN